MARDLKQIDKNRVPNGELFSYSVGLAGQNISYGYISGWIKYFCTNLLHIAPKKVGTIFFISYFWDALNDPVIGALTDRFRFKNGEKLRPYLAITPPIIGALAALMFMNVSFDETGKIFYILVIYFVWDFFYSFQDVALWGMVATSSPLSQERARVAQWVSIGAGAGGAIAGVFQMLRSILNSFGLADMQVFMICALLFGLGGEIISFTAHRIKERVRSDKSQESLWQSLSIIRYNRTLLLISLARFLTGLSLKVQNAYFFENMVSYDIASRHINGMEVEFIYGIITGLPGVFAVFFATKFAKKIGGMKKILLVAQISTIILRVISYFIGYQSIGQMVAVMLLMSVTSIPNSMLDIAHRSLTSDSIDYVEWKTGMRTEGVSFSMQNFTTKMTSAVGNYVEGALLSLLGYSSADKAAGIPQNATFKKWQWPMFMLGPVIGCVLYLAAIAFVRDDREQQARIELELSERRKLAEQAEIPAEVQKI